MSSARAADVSTGSSAAETARQAALKKSVLLDVVDMSLPLHRAVSQPPFLFKSSTHEGLFTAKRKRTFFIAPVPFLDRNYEMGQDQSMRSGVYETT
jgi:hypothetical protein